MKRFTALVERNGKDKMATNVIIYDEATKVLSSKAMNTARNAEDVKDMAKRIRDDIIADSLIWKEFTKILCEFNSSEWSKGVLVRHEGGMK